MSAKAPKNISQSRYKQAADNSATASVRKGSDDDDDLIGSPEASSELYNLHRQSKDMILMEENQSLTMDQQMNNISSQRQVLKRTQKDETD